MVYFKVGKGCGAARAPVDDALPAVNQAFVIKIDKSVTDG
jgi:hypothetical protein